MKTINTVPPKERKEWRDLLTGKINVPLKNFFFQMKVTQAKNQVTTGKISIDKAIDDLHALCIKFFKTKNMNVDLSNIFLSSDSNDTLENETTNQDAANQPESTKNNAEENTKKLEQKKQETIELLKIKEEKQKLENERQKLKEERRKLEAERIRLEAEKTIQAKLLQEKLKLKKQREMLEAETKDENIRNVTESNFTDSSELENTNEDIENAYRVNDQFLIDFDLGDVTTPKRSFFSRIFGIFKK